MPFFVIKKGLVLLEWKYFPTPKILDPYLSEIRVLKCWWKRELYLTKWSWYRVTKNDLGVI